MTTSNVAITPGSGAYVANYSISEDTLTKQIQRIGLNNSAGVEIDTLRPLNPVGGMTAQMTGTASTLLIAAPGSGLYNYITAVIISNAHASVDTEVVLQDGNGGTAFATFPAAHAYGGCCMPLPSPRKQPTSNTALYCADLTTGAAVTVTVIGFTGP